MDPELAALMRPTDLPEGRTETNIKLRIKEDHSGEIEVETPDGYKPYTLKPLADLYGSGTGTASVDPKDERFMPLMLSIEEEIARAYGEDPGLTDGAVSLALGALGMSPEGPQADPLARGIQLALRLTLSLSNFSRQEVRQALRHIGRSVERHTRSDERRGYLQFISAYFGRSRR